MMKTILITGINGFLGSNLAKVLYPNYNIIGTEVLLENLSRIKDYNFPVYDSNVEKIQNLFNNFKIDIIIHTATFYGRGSEELRQIFESNLRMPFYLLDIAVMNNVNIFINVDTVLERFINSYSLSKRQFNDWLLFRKNEIKIVNMQLEHFYGPGSSNANFITAMIEKLIRNEPIINLTGGEQKRDFIYYTDVIEAFIKVIDNIDNINDSYSNFQVCSGELIKIKELMILLKKLTKSKSELNFGAVPYRENEIMISKSSNEKLKKLGWKPKVSLVEGLKITINKQSGTLL